MSLLIFLFFFQLSIVLCLFVCFYSFELSTGLSQTAKRKHNSHSTPVENILIFWLFFFKTRLQYTLVVEQFNNFLFLVGKRTCPAYYFVLCWLFFHDTLDLRQNKDRCVL
jgi:hypothetical protein